MIGNARLTRNENHEFLVPLIGIRNTPLATYHMFRNFRNELGNVTYSVVLTTALEVLCKERGLDVRRMSHR